MDSFKAVYRILNFLKMSELHDEFDDESFTPEYFGITERQFTSTLKRALDDGHIKGIILRTWGYGYAIENLSAPMITTAGLEYLEENSFMKKAARLAKGIR